MKTTIEVNGFEIKIEELEGKIVVSAHKDDEVIEEFELATSVSEVETEEEEEGEEVMPFGEEENDFEEAQEEEEESEEMEEMEELEEEEEEEEGEGKLESFSAFIKNRKK